MGFKSGHPLKDISAIDRELLARLRDQFSVTTAEELIGLWRAAPEALTKALGGHENTELLIRLATSALSQSEKEDIEQAEKSPYPYSTGHEPPPGGKGIY